MCVCVCESVWAARKAEGPSAKAAATGSRRTRVHAQCGFGGAARGLQAGCAGASAVHCGGHAKGSPGHCRSLQHWRAHAPRGHVAVARNGRGRHGGAQGAPGSAREGRVGGGRGDGARVRGGGVAQRRGARKKVCCASGEVRGKVSRGAKAKVEANSGGGRALAEGQPCSDGVGARRSGSAAHAKAAAWREERDAGASARDHPNVARQGRRGKRRWERSALARDGRDGAGVCSGGVARCLGACRDGRHARGRHHGQKVRGVDKATGHAHSGSGIALAVRLPSSGCRRAL